MKKTKPGKSLQPLPDRILEDPDKSKYTDEREDKFIELLGICKTVRDAAREAGYSETYCNGSIYTKIKSPRFQRRLIRRYKEENAVHLAKVSRINENVLNQLIDETDGGNLKNVGKTQHVVRQALQVAGLLEQKVEVELPKTIKVVYDRKGD